MFTAVLLKIFFCPRTGGEQKIPKNQKFFFRSNCQKWAQTRSKCALAKKISFLRKSTLSGGQNHQNHLALCPASPCPYKKLF